jgi:hypothetical protein
MQQRAFSEDLPSLPFRAVYSVVIGRATTMLMGERVGTISVICRSLEGHETPDGFVLTPHTVPYVTRRHRRGAANWKGSCQLG